MLPQVCIHDVLDKCMNSCSGLLGCMHGFHALMDGLMHGCMHDLLRCRHGKQHIVKLDAANLPWYAGMVAGWFVGDGRFKRPSIDVAPPANACAWIENLHGWMLGISSGCSACLEWAL
eukprot:jgi/Mesvir1/10139/Mv26345-RA.1